SVWRGWAAEPLSVRDECSRLAALDLSLQLLAGVEGDDSPCGDGDLLPGLGITAWPLGLVAQLEIPETRQLHAFAALERGTDLVEEGFDHVLGFALVQSDPFEQHFRQLCLGQRELRRCRR